MENSVFSSQELSEIRKLYPFLEKEWIYLNHAAISPLSRRVTERIEAHLKRRSSEEVATFNHDIPAIEATRKRLQHLFNADSEDRIALLQNTSQALNIIARGLPWDAGDRIIVNDLEFPSNVYPYLNLAPKGVKVDKISHNNGRVTPEMIEEYITDRTRMVALSAVQFLSGYRADLHKIGEICKQNGIWFVVDGIQALGATPVDVQKMQIDALASGAHKWLMGPQGFGMLYLTEKLQNHLVEHDLGWLSVEDPWKLFNHNQSTDATARRFELGTPNIFGVHSLHASLDLFSELGHDNIYQRISYLAGLLIDTMEAEVRLQRFSPKDESERAGIVTYHLPEDTDLETLIPGLKEHQLHVAVREGKLRLAPHFYNTEAEISRAVEILKRYLQ